MKHLYSALALSMAVPLSFGQDLVLSDFPAGLAQAPGWVWEGFADTVMGGNSSLASPGIVNTPAGPA